MADWTTIDSADAIDPVDQLQGGTPAPYNPPSSGLGTAGNFAAGGALGSALGLAFKGNSPANTLYRQAFPSLMAANAMQAQATQANVVSQEQQAGLAAQTAGFNAGQQAYEGMQARENQAAGYNASGVLLEGTPLTVLEKTRQLAQQQVNLTLAQGTGEYNRMTTAAGITANQGRAALLGQNTSFNSGAANAAINQSQIKQGAFGGVVNDVMKIGSNPYSLNALGLG